MTGIQFLGIRNPRCGIQNPRLSWIPIHGAIKEFTAKVDKVKDERFYYDIEVHQRRESLRLFGIEESSTADSDEGTKQVLEDFLEDKLGIAIAENLDFQRVHPTGKFSNSKGNQGR